MPRILIAGGGGFGLELWDYLHADMLAGRWPDRVLGGVLNDGEDCELVRRNPQVPFLGTIVDYQPQPDDAVVIAVGSPAGRHLVATRLQERGARLFTYVHPDARVSTTATLGEGCIVGPFSVINAHAALGENVAVNVHCSVGHGSRIGAHSVLSPFCSISGDARLGEGCFLGTRATLFPKIALGDHCTVDAHSAVRQSAADRQLISVRGQTLVVPNRLAGWR